MKPGNLIAQPHGYAEKVLIPADYFRKMRIFSLLKKFKFKKVRRSVKNPQNAFFSKNTGGKK